MSSNTNTKKTNNSGGKKQRWKGKKSSKNTSKDTFKGDCDDLKGKVYFIGSAKQADNYNKTTVGIFPEGIHTWAGCCGKLGSSKDKRLHQ